MAPPNRPGAGTVAAKMARMVGAQSAAKRHERRPTPRPGPTLLPGWSQPPPAHRRPLNQARSRVAIQPVNDRTFVLSCRRGGAGGSSRRRRVSRGSVQVGAQPRQGHVLQLVPESLHGLRASMRLLLRPRFRAPRRSALRRPLRPHRAGQAQRCRRPAHRAVTQVMEEGDDRHRRRHRPLPTRRRSIQAHPQMPRGAA